MKKNIVRILIVLAFVFLLTGCGEKRAIDAATFEQVMTDRYQYAFRDKIEEREEYSYITVAYAAANPNYVQFYCNEGTQISKDDNKCYVLAEDGTLKKDEEGNLIVANYKEVVYDPNYQIEYYMFDTVENAKSNYETNKIYAAGLKTAENQATEVKEKNYSKYVLDNGERYVVVSRIDNTLIYFDVIPSQKTTMDTILSTFGY